MDFIGGFISPKQKEAIFLFYCVLWVGNFASPIRADSGKEDTVQTPLWFFSLPACLHGGGWISQPEKHPSVPHPLDPARTLQAQKYASEATARHPSVLALETSVSSVCGPLWSGFGSIFLHGRVRPGAGGQRGGPLQPGHRAITGETCLLGLCESLSARKQRERGFVVEQNDPANSLQWNFTYLFILQSHTGLTGNIHDLL